MTLLLTVLAAILTTFVWYTNRNRKLLHLGSLCLMYWGASIMWFVDSIMEYIEPKTVEASSTDLLNDSLLGLSVVVLGLLIWLCILLYTKKHAPKEHS